VVNSSGMARIAFKKFLPCMTPSQVEPEDDEVRRHRGV